MKHFINVGPMKNLRSQQDSNLLPPKHLAGALSTWATENSWRARPYTRFIFDTRPANCKDQQCRGHTVWWKNERWLMLSSVKQMWKWITSKLLSCWSCNAWFLQLAHLFCLDLLIRGTELMMHPDLEIDVEFLGPLLSPKVEQELMDS